MLYSIHAVVTGSKYLGDVEADSPEEAEEKAWDLDTAHVSLCHHCSTQCENPEIDRVEVVPQESKPAA